MAIITRILSHVKLTASDGPDTETESPTPSALVRLATPQTIASSETQDDDDSDDEVAWLKQLAGADVSDEESEDA